MKPVPPSLPYSTTRSPSRPPAKFQYSHWNPSSEKPGDLILRPPPRLTRDQLRGVRITSCSSYPQTTAIRAPPDFRVISVLASVSQIDRSHKWLCQADQSVPGVCRKAEHRRRRRRPASLSRNPIAAIRWWLIVVPKLPPVSAMASGSQHSTVSAGWPQI